MIGGGGRKLLAVAARQADIIQLRPRVGRAGGANGDDNEVTVATYRRKLDWIREVAGDTVVNRLPGLPRPLQYCDRQRVAIAVFVECRHGERDGT
jgi:hypothetical protein